MINVYVSRDSVCAGDDCEAPHGEYFAFSVDIPVEEIIESLAASTYLATIAGGKATWVASSRVLLAVIAQQWEKPRMLFRNILEEDMDIEEDILRIHFSYLTQQDPELVYEMLSRLTLKAQ